MPNRLQDKAICSALNLLFVKKITLDADKTVSVSVNDLNKQWFMRLTAKGFTPLAQKVVGDNHIQLSTDLATIFAAQRRSQLINALEREAICVVANNQDKQAFLSAFEAITQPQIDNIVNRGYRFLRMTPPARIDINKVVFDDIECQQDVDFIRDHAVNIEKTDLPKALRLMEIAHKARPEGLLFVIKWLSIASYYSRNNFFCAVYLSYRGC
ncbi:hypothetical protein [Shewanella phaeophyticola]|uniref:Uncharacterized protein n=1 Tax=Shewanella phaeophyticola TaxID=2978345 RepID=A0ABT2NZW5_9GAMM|nr:hypothetical protein [Shewanella sp. KJ10-1]MCT8985747.1 hypothetical protein [Shewanella sp. KJ10-1]